MENTQQGLQNQLFSIFVFLFVIVQLVLQIIPSFVTQRTLYESRERQSKTYAWQAFVLSNIAVEFFWNTVSLAPVLINLSLANTETSTRSWQFSASSPGTTLSVFTGMLSIQTRSILGVLRRFLLSGRLSSLPVRSHTC